MHVIRLPKRLPATSDLVALNQRLHNGEISLDWSDVQTAVEPQQLETLLAGLHLSEHIDLIGAETIPETLLPALLAAFETVEKQAKDVVETKSPTDDQHHGHSIITPALWLPEHAAVINPEEDVAEKSARAGDPNEGRVDPVRLEADVQELSVEVQEERSTTLMTATTSATPILKIPTSAELRDELEDLVLRDLLGPAGGEEEEVDEFRVYDRYLVGIITPNDAEIPAEELDSLGTIEEGSDEQGPHETDASQTKSLSPSSIGMSFCVDVHATHLQVTARWGHYQKRDSLLRIETKGRSTKVWKRVPRGGTWDLPLQEGPITRWQPEKEEQPDVFVKGVIRRSSTCWTVTLFLVNGQVLPKRSRDTAFLFQPELIVDAPGGGPIFQRRPTELQHIYKEEDQALAMLYRRQVGFAIGHGVSVHAQTLPNDSTCAVRLSTQFIPCYEVPRTQAPTTNEIPELAGLCLDMYELSEADRTSLSQKLHPLVRAYASWIEEQRDRIANPHEDLWSYRTVAEDAIEQCRSTLERMRAGIALLTENPDAARAFAFMNRAMWQQRIHTIYAEEQRRQGAQTIEEIDCPSNRSWRPFQLAFILLNIPALTNLNHPDRSTDPNALADLLWFPTGGGKTEAYLGLTAYTLAIRRLQGTIAGRSGQDGVAVIMRYTLRLLTLQQFQRAAALICACELIRRRDPITWGRTPFRLGLWVGQRSTPNTTSECAQAINQDHGVQGGRFVGYGNPRQLTHCPWCGLEIAAGKDIIVETYEKGRGRTFMYCSDPYGQCPFTRAQSKDDGLPVLVVDEEIYRLLPALLIATVDKFAQLPWQGETQMLFGQVNKYCERHGFRSPEIRDSDSHKTTGRFPSARSVSCGPLRPPDLIIQDELHLISGPLGTLVGLYETAVDHLSTWQVNGQQVRPKVIAATATIRQAGLQMQALFMRKANIFPPQGLDIEDNFFSRQRKPGPDAPGRRYLGICANGRRMKAVQIRVYLAFLAAAQTLYEKYGPRADPWMTLVGYFNSMSDLGSMRHLVDDDISNRIWKMDRRGLAKRGRPKVKELTSRVSSADIPDVLSNLEQTFGMKEGIKPIDVLLATNMISVGVDVKRLGLMVVSGQPKTTAEYIQATSRVGRNVPGLVCIIYHWSRPRDLSHYEQFEHYHATFYQHVEALSVTPFAPRALDRGLAALLTSIVRLSSPALNKNDMAGQITPTTAPFHQVREAIIQRASEVAGPEAVERIRADLQSLESYWLKQASTSPSLGYEKQQDGITLNLLKRPKRGKWEPFTCLNSLRNVEPSVTLLLDERSLGTTDMDIEDEEEQQPQEISEL